LAARAAKLRGVPSPREATSRAVARRRRTALAAAALVALLLGAGIGALGDGGSGGGAAPGTTAPAGGVAPGATPADGSAPADATGPLAQARRDVARMSLERQVGELLVIAFGGTRAPAYVLDALRGGRAAGVILFGGNAPSAASVRALTARLRRATGPRPPAIVCLDQEGGAIRTLRFAPSAIGQAGQPTPAAARAAAASTARALRGVGVNVVLGPVADVAAGASGSVMAGRAYPGGAAAVSASVRAAVSAYLRAGMLPTAKHFPGLGGATVNTDRTPARVNRTRAQIEAADLEPFRAAADAGAPLVMVGHARYPALDARRIASQSHAIVTDLLRGQLGFEGVVMTDSLEARASLATTGGDVGAAAVRALDAGADLLLSTGPGSFPLVRDAVLAQARRSPAVRARVADAAARVLALRRALPTAPR
jgi:beta-N-acetylhexosaminidase